MSRTLIDKVLDDHVIHEFDGGDMLLHVDRHWLNDGGYHALAELDRRRLPVRDPQLTFAVIDHLIETRSGRTYASRIPNAELWARGTIEGCRRHGIQLIDLSDPRHGITHVIAPEMGLSLPGTVVVCTDSHTCTNGALGAYAVGVGSAGSTHVLATQTLLAQRPRTMRVLLAGTADPAASAKDVVLHVIGTQSAAGALGHAIEFAGPIVEDMSMPERMTLCNMGVELGAVTAMIAPDAVTYGFLKDREFAPEGIAWEAALRYWEALRTDDGARFDREVTVDCNGLAPQVTWGTSPQHVTEIGGHVPHPAAAGSDRRSLERALAYMGLTPGAALADVPIDAAFIGSCTNARLDDLRAAAEVLRGRRAAAGVRGICIPGSATVKREAEAEGLHRVFLAAGFQWGEAGCSMCTGAAADRLPPGSRVVSSTNRNFEHRQGPGVRTHLASPATVAASAVAGRLADVRKLAAS